METSPQKGLGRVQFQAPSGADLARAQRFILQKGENSNSVAAIKARADTSAT